MNKKPKEFATKEKIEELLKLKYPAIYNWEYPLYYDGLSPFDRVFLDDFTSKRTAWLETATTRLSKIIAQAIDLAIIELNLVQETNSIPAICELFLELDKLAPIPWWAAGFNVESHRAEFEHWVRLDHWELDDAVALSVGFEPTTLQLDSVVKEHVSKEVFQFIVRRRHLIENKFFKFGKNQVFKPSPEEFCQWACDVKLEIPTKLIDAVNAIRGTKVRSFKQSSYIPPKIENREKASMLKLIIGMAVRGYGYDINSQRSPIPNQISTDLELLGIPLHADTIRSYLREATSTLPRDDLDE